MGYKAFSAVFKICKIAHATRAKELGGKHVKMADLPTKNPQNLARREVLLVLAL